MGDERAGEQRQADAAPRPRPWRGVVGFGLLGGGLIAGLRALEYRYLVLEHSIEIYAGIVAAVFAVLGIWLGGRFTRPRERVVLREVPVAVPAPAQFVRDEAALRRLGLTPRELGILELIAAGLSTREIAARVFLSENTVKTHTSRVFEKLGARRRVQAVQRAREQRLIPWVPDRSNG
jgi:DNA-binding CsgD family transcriptional regulator